MVSVAVKVKFLQAKPPSPLRRKLEKAFLDFTQQGVICIPTFDQVGNRDHIVVTNSKQLVKLAASIDSSHGVYAVFLQGFETTSFRYLLADVAHSFKLAGVSIVIATNSKLDYPTRRDNVTAYSDSRTFDFVIERIAIFADVLKSAFETHVKPSLPPSVSPRFSEEDMLNTVFFDAIVSTVFNSRLAAMGIDASSEFAQVAHVLVPLILSPYPDLSVANLLYSVDSPISSDLINLSTLPPEFSRIEICRISRELYLTLCECLTILDHVITPDEVSIIKRNIFGHD